MSLLIVFCTSAYGSLQIDSTKDPIYRNNKRYRQLDNKKIKDVDVDYTININLWVMIIKKNITHKIIAIDSPLARRWT